MSLEMDSTANAFCQEQHDVICIFTCLGFASKTTLGYDPTVQRILENNRIQYQYEIIGENDEVKTYITTGVLSDFRAESVEGRATRVWMAYDRDDSDKTEVILKDLWMFTNTTPESIIVRNLCE